MKLLLTSTPTAKPKTESINILCDVIPEEMPCSMVQTMKLGFDINRHKEMIVKAVSAILLLLLKHLKVNHIYQVKLESERRILVEDLFSSSSIFVKILSFQIV